MPPLHTPSGPCTAAPARVIPIFKGDKPFDGSGKPLRKSLALPSWSKLAGKERLELDMQLSCPGSNDTGEMREWSELGMLWVVCRTGQAGLQVRSGLSWICHWAAGEATTRVGGRAGSQVDMWPGETAASAGGGHQFKLCHAWPPEIKTGA